MGEEKIEQNVDRLRLFLFHSLGCSKGDAMEIIDRLIKNYIDTMKE